MENEKTPIEKLRDIGLLGCLSDSEVTSENYKQFIYDSIEEKYGGNEGQDMTEWYGTKVVITGPVKFVGDPKDDPENNEGFQMWKKAYHEVHQPERSKREASERIDG